MSKKVISESSYSIKITKYSDGTSDMHRVSNGITALELLGIFQLSTKQIIDQLENKAMPENIQITINN